MNKKKRKNLVYTGRGILARMKELEENIQEFEKKNPGIPFIGLPSSDVIKVHFDKKIKGNG